MTVKVAIAAILIIAIILAIVLPITIVLGDEDQEVIVGYSLCEVDPSQCEGLSEETQEYISNNFETKDESLSAVQAAKILDSVNPNATPEEQTTTYLKIKKAIECMNAVMPQKAEKAFS